MSDALTAPITVRLAVGQPAVVRFERPVIVVTDSPPGLVHPIVHGSTVLLVPVREGSTVVALGLGDGLSAKLAVLIGTEAGIRLISLSGSAVRAASAVPTHTQAPLRQPDPTLASPADVADPPGNAVGSFIATLSPDQRQAVLDYLRSPSLVSLSTLVRMLNAAQQHMLVDVLASHDAVTAGAPRTPQQAPSLAAAPPQPAHGTAPPTLAQVDPGVTVSAPAGIAVHVIPTVTGSLLYLSYVLQNNTNGTLHADPHEVQATGGQPLDVRQMDPGAPGMIAVGSVEMGVIRLSSLRDRVSVTWRLRNDAGDVVPVGILVTSPR